MNIYRVTWRVTLVEQELFTLPEHLSSPMVFNGVRAARSYVFCVVFLRFTDSDYLQTFFSAKNVYFSFYSITCCIISAVGLFGLTGGVYLSDQQQASALAHNGATVDIYCNSWGTYHGYGFLSMGSLTKQVIEFNIANVSLNR